MFFRQSALRKDLALTIGGARYAYQRDSHIFSFRDIAVGSQRATLIALI
jgi:hypothetical protein